MAELILSALSTDTYTWLAYTHTFVLICCCTILLTRDRLIIQPSTK